MARWRLKNPHYMKIAGNEWQYEELTREGKRLFKRYEVPQYLNPEAPSDQNYPGEIIVALKESRQFPRDYIFTGKPTPDMEPLDEEAEKLSEEESVHWQAPFDTFQTEGGFSQSLLTEFQRQLEQAIKVNPAQPVSVPTGVPPDAFAKMQEQMAQLMAKNAELEAKLNGMTPVVDDLEPLEDELPEAPVAKAPQPGASIDRRV